MSSEKPQEFWIDPCRHPDSDLDFYFGDALIKHPGQGPLLWQSNLIHVIEYSALQKLQQENAELKKQLESARGVIGFYGDKFNWKRSLESKWADTLKDQDCAYLNCGGGRARKWLENNKEER